MKFIPQFDIMDCGPACICMIANFYGKNYSLEDIRNKSFLTREGVSLLGLIEASENIGFNSFPTKVDIKSLEASKDNFPCILHWNQNHFIVLNRIKKNLFSKKKQYHILDPGYGKIKLDEIEFTKSWKDKEDEGIVLFLSPNEKFLEKNIKKKKKLSLFNFKSYIKGHKNQIIILSFLLLIGSIINLIFPFLTQLLVDKGVLIKDLNIIILILVSQIFLYIGAITIQIYRNWLTLYIGNLISINIISDFLNKLFKLPISFFETKIMGDFSQRIQDNERIEKFLTSESLLTFFSVLTFIVFFCVLLYYDYRILLVYSLMTIFSIIWSIIWMKKRKFLDYFRFQEKSKNQESIYEIISGINEIKLNQLENYKREQWENIQKNLFKINIRILKIEQIQNSGYELINHLKNVFSTFITAFFVVKGSMSIGELLSVSYIIGQMNSPINQLISFFKSYQDAKLSMERLDEVKSHKSENYNLLTYSHKENDSKNLFEFKNVSFQYEGPSSPYILKNINLIIPKNKITAIVGESGSGKTTLLKIILKFYEPTIGKIIFKEDNYNLFSSSYIRKIIGTVMQDGYIFSDTIEKNIICNDDILDNERFYKATLISNLNEFIDNLPLKFNTKIGASGIGLSGGQRQRILIARALYKNPEILLFDEATSALDTQNESYISNNLNKYLKNKTSIIIAHRLSTVKNADQIIVLKKGKIIEQGNHASLLKTKGEYYNLIKNQLELGN